MPLIRASHMKAMAAVARRYADLPVLSLHGGDEAAYYAERPTPYLRDGGLTISAHGGPRGLYIMTDTPAGEAEVGPINAAELARFLSGQDWARPHLRGGILFAACSTAARGVQSGEVSSLVEQTSRETGGGVWGPRSRALANGVLPRDQAAPESYMSNGEPVDSSHSPDLRGTPDDEVNPNGSAGYVFYFNGEVRLTYSVRRPLTVEVSAGGHQLVELDAPDLSVIAHQQ